MHPSSSTLPVPHSSTLSTSNIQKRKNLTTEQIAILATWGRLLLGIALAVVMPISSGVSLVLFLSLVFADIMDGVVARHFNVDTVQRRIADSIVDRLILHLVAISAVLSYPFALSLYLPLAGRDIFAIGACGRLYLQSGIALKGGNLHKLASISSGILFISILTTNHALATLAAVLAWIINFALMVDYIGAASLARAIFGPNKSSKPIRFDVTRLLGIRYLLRAEVSAARPPAVGSQQSKQLSHFC